MLAQEPRRGAAAIAEALRGNGVLTDLNLWANGIGDEGAKAIGEALAVNGVLKTLDLWRCRSNLLLWGTPNFEKNLRNIRGVWKTIPSIPWP